MLDEVDDAAMPTSVRIGYRKPYRFDMILRFLAFRAIEGIECVADDAYWRSVRVFDDAGCELTGWVCVRNDEARSQLVLTVSDGLVPLLFAVVERVSLLFDTGCEPEAVSRGLEPFHDATEHRYDIPGIRVPSSFDGFEMALRAVLGQQISVKAASTLARRLAAEFCEPLHIVDELPEGVEISLAPPVSESFLAPDAAARLGSLGVVRQRQQAIMEMARMVAEGELTLRAGANTSEQEKLLLSIKGIGPWTAQYILMRAYAYPDAFPAEDYGIKHAFEGMKPREIKALSEQWRPWRSYAVMSIWQA